MLHGSSVFVSNDTLRRVLGWHMFVSHVLELVVFNWAQCKEHVLKELVLKIVCCDGGIFLFKI